MAGAKLSDTKISKAKGVDKPYKLADGGGLNLYVTPKGTKYWRWRYRFGGKPQLFTIGAYPSMSLKDARTEHQRLQGVLRGGVNPAVEKKVEKKAEALLAKLNQERSTLAKMQPLAACSEKVVDWPAGSFGAVQKEWFNKWSDGKAFRYQIQMESRIKADILPKLGHRHIADIEAPDIAAMAKAIEDRGAGELARKALRVTSQIYRFAIVKGCAQRNPAADLRPGDVLNEQTVTNCARVDHANLPALLLAMENYTGTKITWYALQTMARTFLRATELRETWWAELDLDRDSWKIPKERMKIPAP